ncbi:MAG: T9SS type A sorting domain-containing protein [Candidatus Cloacimonadota bacterium]|nr:MAG: T9SS type A sorting domain-containing protein [Candidatus Cloacimonadota bacterium]
MGVANSDIYADFVDSGAVGIEGKIQPISCSKRLLVYSSPNPFTKTVKIRVFSSENRKVYTTLSIYDVCGRLVKHFPVIQFPYYQVIWDGMNEKGDRVSPGVYFCVLRVADKQTTHVLLHVK